MSAKYKSPSFLLPNELNTSANTANNTGINSLYSMDFDGTQVVSQGVGNFTSFNGVSECSVSLWFKSSTSGQGPYKWFFNVPANTSGNHGFGIYASGTSLTSHVYTSSLVEVVTNFSGNQWDGNWHHLVLTYKDGIGLRFYYDSVLKFTNNTMSGTITAGGEELAIGSFSQSAPTAGIIAQIDEVAAFTYALTDGNVSVGSSAAVGSNVYNLYNSGSPVSTATVLNLNPVAYYPLGEQAQNTGKLPQATANVWQFPNGVLQDYVFSFPSSGINNIKLGSSGVNIGQQNTISIWVNFNGTPPAPYGDDHLISTYDGNWMINPNISSGYLCYAATDGTGGNTSYECISGLTYPTGWFLLTVVRNNTNFSLYFNDQLQGSGSESGFTSDTVVGMIGTGNANLQFTHAVSNLTIFNTALSATGSNSVETLYNNGSPLTSMSGFTSLQGWWKLNATSVYTPSAPNYTTALNFDGANTEYIDTNFTGLNNTSAATISAWMNIPVFTNLYALGNLQIDSGTYKGIGFNPGTSTALIYVNNNTSGAATFTFNPSSYYSAGNWFNIVFVFDGSQSGTNRLKVYINNNLVTGTWSGTPLNILETSTSNFLIGNDGQQAAPYFTGQISNVALFNTALTSSQVSTLFNFGTPETNISFNPVAWWKLDDQNAITDSSNNGNTGTNNGATDISSGVAVIPSWKIPNALTIPSINYTTALNFDGTTASQYITAGGTSGQTAFSFAGAGGNDNPFSISGWINLNSNTGGRFIGKSTLSVSGSTNKEWTSNTQNQASMFLYSGSNYIGRVGSTTLNTGEWIFITMTYNGDNSSTGITIYVNGQPETSYNNTYPGTNYTGMVQQSSDLLIGANYTGSAGGYFDGKMSNLAVFNYELTPAQVLTLYNNKQPESSISLSPIGWWKLDSTTITDSSGNGYTGANNGTTQVTSDVYTGNIPVNGVSTTLPSTALQQSDLQFDSPYSNYSLSFDGTVGVTTGGVTGITPSNSICFWFNNSTAAGGQAPLMASLNYTSTSGENFAIRLESTNKLTVVLVKNNTYVILNSNTVLADNNWYFITLTTLTSGSNVTTTLYIDGTQDLTATATNHSNLSDLQNGLTIGYWTASGGETYNFNGKIDESSIFNYSLSAAQVLEMYNNGKPSNLFNYSGTAPICWWRLGENAYFDNNNVTLPNSITGAPNGVSSGTATSMLSADAPGTYANGVGTNLDIVDRVGDAPLSTANSQSYNMIPDDKIPYVPGYIGAQTTNAFEMSFDGVDNSFDLGSEILFDSTKGFSFSAWIKLNSGAYSTSQYPGVFLLKTDQTTGFSMFLSQTSSPSPGYQGINIGSNDIGSNNNFLRIKTDGNISGDFLNTWKHVCLTFDGVDRTATSSYKIYVDGSSVALTNSYLFPAHNNENHLGRGADITNTYFPGNIDEVAIFDKTLTADQVKFDLYNATTSGETADIENNTNLPTPLAWYRMGD